MRKSIGDEIGEQKNKIQDNRNGRCKRNRQSR